MERPVPYGILQVMLQMKKSNIAGHGFVSGKDREAFAVINTAAEYGRKRPDESTLPIFSDLKICNSD